MKKYIPLLLLLVACTPHQLYVKADRATYNVVAPEYQNYLNQDGRLAPDALARRVRLLDSWDKRITAAEGK